MAEQATAFAPFGRQRDTLEPRAGRRRPAEQRGEVDVDVGEVGLDQRAHRQPFAQHGQEQQLGLPPHRRPQTVVEAREAGRVGHALLQRLQLQPLGGEVGGEGTGARIGEQAIELGNQPGSRRQPARRRRDQRRIRGTGPDEERQPRRQHRPRQRHRDPGGDLGDDRFDAEQEVRRDQCRQQHEPPRRHVVDVATQLLLGRGDDPRQFAGQQRPPPDPRQHRGRQRRQLARRRRAGDRVVHPLLRLRHHPAIERAVQREPFEVQIAVAATRVGVLAVGVVVDERDLDPRRPGRQIDGALELTRLAPVHLERSDLGIPDADHHQRRRAATGIGAGLQPQPVRTRARQLLGARHPTVGAETGAAVVLQHQATFDDLELAAIAAAPRRSRRILPVDHRGGDRFGRGQVLLEMQRRERQRITDRVEAVAEIVGREAGGGHLDAEQVAHAVLPLRAIEAPHRGTTRIHRQLRHLDREPRLHRGSERGARRGIRQCIVVERRHLAGLHPLLQPRPTPQFRRRIRGRPRQVQLALHGVAAVAVDAVLLHERSGHRGILCRRRARQRPGGQHEPRPRRTPSVAGCQETGHATHDAAEVTANRRAGAMTVRWHPQPRRAPVPPARATSQYAPRLSSAA